MMRHFGFILLFHIIAACNSVIVSETLPYEKDTIVIKNSLPEYYNDGYLERKVFEINNSIRKSEDNSERFIFITDTHFDKNACLSGALIRYITGKTSINKIFHGGDVGSVTSLSNNPSGINLLNDNIEKFLTTLVNINSDCNFYALRGNHDFNNRVTETAFDGFAPSDVRQFYLSIMSNVVHNETDTEGLYYYFDNNLTRIRYIGVDTSYGNKLGAAKLGVMQLQWLLNEAIETTPDDYEIVLLTHIPIALGVDTSGEFKSFQPLKSIICAVNNNRAGSVTYEGQVMPYDFTSTKYRISCVLSGHLHADCQTFEDGVLFITTTCDKLIEKNYSQYTEKVPYQRIKGEVTEQAFDVVTINHNFYNSWVNMIRIGGGYNRSFHYSEIRLTPQSVIDIKNQLLFVDPVKWVSTDAPGPLWDNGRKEWSYSSSVVSVENGIVTAINNGSSLVFAEDAKHNKEFFCFTVIGY